MGYITIDNNGQPWLICIPTDQGDLDRFMDASRKFEVGSGFAHRQATQPEAAKCAAAHAIYLYGGGDHDKFFGIPA